ncbi:MAG: class I SAM-dependent methyltransferase [Proteobacteria bacterium]|nr:class I SAM-dependent methyltransferase [Pseudomonadota bacterium]
MIEKDKVKRFWDARAQTYDSLPFESIANLEQDADNLELKIRLETEKVFAWLPQIKDRNILDLGAGVGQWSFRFVDYGAKSIVAVEYSEPLSEIGRLEALCRGVQNIEFVVSPAEDYIADRSFDIIFISGLFVYMNDDQAAKLMANFIQACHAETIILLRDGTGIEGRYEINDRFSEHLNVHYSATYRSRNEYLEMFNKAGLSRIKDENMFDESCSLNKYPETRLRVYLFKVK